MLASISHSCLLCAHEGKGPEAYWYLYRKSSRGPYLSRKFLDSDSQKSCSLRRRLAQSMLTANVRRVCLQNIPNSIFWKGGGGLFMGTCKILKSFLFHVYNYLNTECTKIALILAVCVLIVLLFLVGLSLSVYLPNLPSLLSVSWCRIQEKTSEEKK